MTMRRLLLNILGTAAICLLIVILMRPEKPHQKVPKSILYSHYRIVAKVDGEGVACGTGIAISSRRILTAAHVIEDGTTYELDMFEEDGKELRTIPLHLIKTAPKDDLALLEADEDLPYWNDLDLGDYSVGSWGYVVGAAHGTVPYNAYFGVFASKHGPWKIPTCGQMALTVPPGESGGGVYSTETNQLVGVFIRSKEGLAFFVQAKMISEFLSSVP